MRVWLAPSAFFPHKGGVEELTLKIAQHMQRLGHETLVLTNQYPRNLPSQDEVEGVPVIRLAFEPPGRRPLALARYLQFQRRSRSLLDNLGRRPDVLHVICASAQLAPLTRWSRQNRLPLVITTQGETQMDANALYERSYLMRRTLRRSAECAAALSACSRWTADKAAEVAPAFGNAAVILNGVDPDDWPAAPVPSGPVICAWGRHVPQKGFDLLLQAFTLVRQQNPAATLLVGGSGPDFESLSRSAGEGVVFVGPLDRAGVRSLLARSRVAVVPSRIEPFGIVAVEALAMGRQIVYSVHGGLAEAAGDLGIAVDPHDPVALSEALLSAIARRPDPASARSRAEELSWSRLTKQYLDLYEVALKRHAEHDGWSTPPSVQPG